MNICILLICLNSLQYSYQNTLRILNGRDARPSEFSYVARIDIYITNPNTKEVSKSFVCTCTVITKVWTLTAGHCTKGLENSLIEEGSGAKGVIAYDTKETRMKYTGDIVRLLTHPDYFHFHHQKAGFYIRNDVGLVKTKEIHMAKYGKISAVDYTTLYGYELMAVGFGLMNSSNGMGMTFQLNKPLQVVKVLAKKCESSKRNMYPMLCLAQRCGTAAALCPGDSGAPALHHGRVVAVITGGEPQDHLTSNLRNRPNIVGYLTPISVYLDWIATHMNAVDNND